MKAILNRLIQHQTIGAQEAKEILLRISGGEFNQSQIVSFLTVYMMRGITLEELTGFRQALQELCITINLKDYNTIDLCGTGGDGKDTFNISTLASFVVAGAGYKVAKHGNYGVSSHCGSSNVLEHLGIVFTNQEQLLQQQIEQANICILHAPLFHPAMKNLAPIRKELGVKTFFNMLGPLVNPSMPNNQIVGVFSLELFRLYQYLLQDSNQQFSVIHSLDGYDEVSLTCPTKIANNGTEQMLNPEDFGFSALDPNAILGGKTVQDSANIFMQVLNNHATSAQNQVVLANAALAINTIHPNFTLQEALSEAQESLLSGKALACFNQLKNLSK